MTNPAIADDTTWTTVKRQESLATSGEAEVAVEQVDPTSTADAYAVTDDNDLPQQKKDLDGNVVTSGGVWSETAFNIGGTDVTKE